MKSTDVVIRIIKDGPHTAAFNMAADLYLLETYTRMPGICVRFYEWCPPAISIGYMQNPAHLLDSEACRRDGIEWVRRPTGGRAVLHMEDLTYSCTFSTQITAMGRDIGETYELISNCLIRGLSLAGVRCEPSDSTLNAREVRREIKLPCFLAPNRREIMVEGRKLVGSAQKRSAQAALQHGSIPITAAFRRLAHYQNLSAAQRAAQTDLLTTKCACIEELIGETKLCEFLTRGFEQVLPFAAQEKPWTEQERSDIHNRAQSQAFQQQWLQ